MCGNKGERGHKMKKKKSGKLLRRKVASKENLCVCDVHGNELNL